MAKQITELDPAAAVAGADFLWLEQSGLPKKVTMTEIAAFTGGGGGGGLTETAVITTAGWYRIATNSAVSARGAATFYISNSGGGAAPSPRVFRIVKGWGATLTDATISMLPGVTQLYETLEQIRIIYDKNGNDEIHVEVFIGSGSASTWDVTVVPDPGIVGTWAVVDFTAGGTFDFVLTWNLASGHIQSGWKTGDGGLAYTKHMGGFVTALGTDTAVGLSITAGENGNDIAQFIRNNGNQVNVHCSGGNPAVEFNRSSGANIWTIGIVSDKWIVANDFDVNDAANYRLEVADAAMTYNRRSNNATTLILGEASTLRGDAQNSALVLYGEESSTVFGAQFSVYSSNMGLQGFGGNPVTNLQMSMNLQMISATLTIDDGRIQLSRAAGGEIMFLRDTGGAGATANPYLAFYDSATTRQGYVGFGSTGSQNMQLVSDAGDVDLIAGGGEIRLQDNTVITGTLAISSTALVTNLNADLLDGVQGSGYATSGHTHSAFDRASSVLSGANVFSNITVTDGITTAIATRALTAANVGALGVSAQAADSLLLRGISMSTTGDSAPAADNVVRTNTNSYTYVGWLNTVSGATTADPVRIYATNDAFLRYMTPVNFINFLEGEPWNFTATPQINGVNIATLNTNWNAADITAGTLVVGRGGTGVTSSTGTGSTVRSISPTFTGTIIAAAATFSGTLTANGTLAVGTTMTKSGTGLVVNLNADRVDSLHAFNFLRSDANDACTGIITFSGHNVQSGGSYSLQDNIEVRFGTGGDTDLYFSGTDFFIDMRPGVDFRLRGGAGGTESMITALADGAVELFMDSNVEFRTQDSNGTFNITGAEVKHWDGTFYDVGLAKMPKHNFASSFTVSDTHWHKRLVHNGTGTLNVTFNTETSMPNDVVMWVQAKNGIVVLIDGSMVLHFYDGASTPVGGNITIARGGWATIVKDTDTLAHVTGVGLTQP